MMMGMLIIGCGFVIKKDSKRNLKKIITRCEKLNMKYDMVIGQLFALPMIVILGFIKSLGLCKNIIIISRQKKLLITFDVIGNTNQILYFISHCS